MTSSTATDTAGASALDVRHSRPKGRCGNTADSAPLLTVRGAAKRFGGTRALDGVDLDIRAGEINALLGENGAGKSTLIKVLAGIHDLDEGQIEMDGHEIHPAHERLPISFIHQDMGLVSDMTVAENVALVAGYPRRGGVISWRASRRRAAEVLAKMDVDLDPGAELGTLGPADLAMVAIARALAVDCRVLVLDEPTASLPASDVARLYEAVRALKREGVGIVYVTHRLDEVRALADTITILRNGRTVSNGPIDAYTEERIFTDIVGRSLSRVFVRGSGPTDEPVLEVAGLVGAGVGPVTFGIHRKEMVGLVGLRGAGHTTVGRMIVGDVKPAAGRLDLHGRELIQGHLRKAYAAGIGFLPGNRQEEGVFADMLVRENLYPNLALRGRHRAPLIPRTEKREARGATEAYGVRTAGTEVPISTLSGGNAQKVVLARWLESARSLMVLEDPTSGVDIGAKAEIYSLLAQMLDRGSAAVLVSSDFEEVAGICHRALVVRGGEIVAELSGDELTVDSLLATAAGGWVQKEAQNDGN